MAHDDTARLQALLMTLDNAGLPGTFPEARALLGRAAEVEQHADDQAAAAERTRADLVQAVLDRGMPLEEAARRLSAVAAWLPTSPTVEGQRRGRVPADALTEPVARLLRVRAVQAARGAWLDAHAALAKRAAEAVTRAVAAGKRLIDVPRVAAILTPPKWNRPPEGTGHYFVNDPSRQHPWMSNPPVLPPLDAADVQRDPARWAAWGEAANAYAAFLAVHELAAVLHEMTGGSSTMFGGKTDNDALSFLTEGLPTVVHLAVTDALGWKPGLHLSLRPAPTRATAPADKMAGWASPAEQQGALLAAKRLLGVGRGM